MKYCIEREKWNKPHYEGHYDKRATQYEGIRCRCGKCEISFVFEAREQKRQFELLSRHPFWKPTLCQTCQNEWEEIKPKLQRYEIKWMSQDLQPSDHKALKEWLALIELSSSYRKKDYSSRAKMLRKMLPT